MDDPGGRDGAVDGRLLRAAWFQRVHNIGDALSPQVLDHVTGCRSYLDRTPDRPHLLAIGSLLAGAREQTYVWGTGLLHPDFGCGGAVPDRILALRGKLSHAALRRAGTAVGDVPLGDPGFLLPRLLAPADRAPPRFQLGLVPHYVDRRHPFFLAAARHEGVKVFDVCDPPEVFFRDFGACAAIASTSLHGLIFAEALGLPNCWLEVSDRILGAGFKFADWFSLAANPQDTPYRPARWESADDVVARCEPRAVAIDTAALTAALTDAVIEDCTEHGAPDRVFVPLARCRARPVPVFIVARDRLADVERAIAMCRRQSCAVEIICDAGNDTAAEVLEALPRLERDGVRLLRRQGTAPDQTLDDAIRAYFASWCEPQRYAITDGAPGPWIDDPLAIATYDRLLDSVLPANRAGPLRPGDPAVDDAAVFAVPMEIAGHAGPQTRRCVLQARDFDGGLALYRSGPLPLSPISGVAVVEDDAFAAAG